MFEKNSLFPIVNLIRNKSIQNFFFIVIIQASNVIASLISMPFLVQTLGLANFGLVNLALSVMIVINIMVDFGFGITGTRAVAVHSNNNKELSKIISEVIFSKLILVILFSFFLFIAVYIFNLFPSLKKVLGFSFIIVFSEALFPFWFFHGLQKLKILCLTNLIGKSLYLISLYLIIESPEQVHLVNFLFGISSVVMNVPLLIYIHFKLKIKVLIPDFLIVFKLIKRNTLLFFTNVTYHFSASGGTIILSLFSNSTTIGMFVLADKISLVLRIFPSIVIQAVFPRASQLYLNDFSRFLIYIKKIALSIFFISALMTTVTFIFSASIMRFISNSSINESVLYLKILSFIPVLASLNVVNIIIFYVKDRKALLFQMSWMVFAFMIISSSFLGFVFGAVGLCYALLMKEFFAFILGIILIIKYEKYIFIKIVKNMV